jgi:hypothetical protein
MSPSGRSDDRRSVFPDRPHLPVDRTPSATTLDGDEMGQEVARMGQHTEPLCRTPPSTRAMADIGIN